MMAITVFYRGWRIEATDRAAVCLRFDGSQERFEWHRQPSLEEALRVAKATVNRLEGPEVWNENYTNEALR